jgi:hypothetical protein
VNAELTRAGVFEYTDADGKVYREYRPAEELQRADAIASLEDASITIGHPRGGVQPESFGALTVGHIRAGSVKVDGRDMVGRLVLARKDAIEGAASGTFVETSMGYDCEIENTPGVFDGQPYDRIQRGHVFNHLALLRADASRLGTALRLDAKGDQEEPSEKDPESESGSEGVSGYGSKGNRMKVKIKKADGTEIELEAGSPEHISHLEAERDAARADARTAHAELARRDALAATAARTALETRAKSLGVEVKADMTDRDLKIAAIKRADSAFDPAGKPDAYVDVRVDLLGTPAAPAVPGAHPVIAAVQGETPAAGRADALDEAQAAAEKAEAEVQDAWRRK